MTTTQLISLGLVQGLTEFLPVSSSGHLILFGKFGAFADQGIGVDIALHIGSLLAVLIYFHKTISAIFHGLWKKYFLPDFKNFGNRLAYLLLVASIPVLIFGFFLQNYGLAELRSPKLIGWTILLYGLLLWVADKYGKNAKSLKQIGFLEAVLIGFAQCLALVPGTSRSGITITMARFLGVARAEAAKFSMLLSVPTIFAAGVLEGWRLVKQGNTNEILWAVDAAVFSFIFSFLVIFLMLKWLKHWSYLPFVIYRVVLGVCLLLYAYSIF